MADLRIAGLSTTMTVSDVRMHADKMAFEGRHADADLLHALLDGYAGGKGQTPNVNALVREATEEVSKELEEAQEKAERLDEAVERLVEASLDAQGMILEALSALEAVKTDAVRQHLARALGLLGRTAEEAKASPA